ncbi:hypothetical protein WJX72_004421 [[Myrmecia] bisecta]|uniref:BZIP domain-containing protein n=1 Tax=[Myrmecia] bisecta TaxID=41462 RepID=A0AAW1PLH2_9CHLO
MFAGPVRAFGLGQDSSRTAQPSRTNHSSSPSSSLVEGSLEPIGLPRNFSNSHLWRPVITSTHNSRADLTSSRSTQLPQQQAASDMPSASANLRIQVAQRPVQPALTIHIKKAAGFVIGTDANNSPRVDTPMQAEGSQARLSSLGRSKSSVAEDKRRSSRLRQPSLRSQDYVGLMDGSGSDGEDDSPKTTREKNRDAQRRFRARQKMIIDTQTERIEQLEAELETALAENERLRKENALLVAIK